jgi:hypothetical protein
MQHSCHPNSAEFALVARDLSLIKYRLRVTRWIGLFSVQWAAQRISPIRVSLAVLSSGAPQTDPAREQTEADRLGIYLVRPSWVSWAASFSNWAKHISMGCRRDDGPTSLLSRCPLNAIRAGGILKARAAHLCHKASSSSACTTNCPLVACVPPEFGGPMLLRAFSGACNHPSPRRFWHELFGSCSGTSAVGLGCLWARQGHRWCEQWRQFHSGRFGRLVRRQWLRCDGLPEAFTTAVMPVAFYQGKEHLIRLGDG